MRTCLYCKGGLFPWQKRFCSHSHFMRYIQSSKQRFAKIFPKNIKKKTSAFLQEMERKEAVMKHILERKDI